MPILFKANNIYDKIGFNDLKLIPRDGQSYN